jgi:retinol dehydrogenase-12
VHNFAIALSVSDPHHSNSIGVNHLSTALISILLMPLMVKTAQNHDTYPRLVIVASETHSHVDITPEVRAAPAILAKLSDKEFCVERLESIVYLLPVISPVPFRNGANMSTRYPVSKLLNVFFTRAFAAHLAPSSAIIADYVNPGFCYSGLSRNAPFPASLVFMVMKLALGRRTAEGAKTLVWAATAGHNDASVRDSLKGAYSSDCRIAAPSDFALSDEGQKIQSRLWVGPCTATLLPLY